MNLSIILYYIKKINVLIFLLFISFSSFAQNEKSSQNELKEIFLSIPDSTFSDNIFELCREERKRLWKLYDYGDYFISKTLKSDVIIGYVDILPKDNNIDINTLIDNQNFLIRIRDPYSDAIPTYDFKIFQNMSNKVIGLTLKYSNHATYNTDIILFYEYKNNEFRNITNEVLDSFNYKKDNYSDSTINLISEIYGRDVRRYPLNRKLLYRFTPSDTVYIFESFFGIDEDLDLDKRYFDGEFFKKKYIMDNGKLRLAE